MSYRSLFLDNQPTFIASTTTSTTEVIMTTETKELMGDNNDEVKSAENGLTVELLIGKNCNTKPYRISVAILLVLTMHSLSPFY